MNRKTAIVGFTITATIWAVTGYILARKARREMEALDQMTELLDLPSPLDFLKEVNGIDYLGWGVVEGQIKQDGSFSDPRLAKYQDHKDQMTAWSVEDFRAEVTKAYEESRNQPGEYNIAQGYMADINGTLWTRAGEAIDDEQLASSVRMLAEMHEADGISDWGKATAKDLLKKVPAHRLAGFGGEGLKDHQS